MLGEMTWLLTQSPLHRALAIGDLEWLVMPALIAEQFYIFRDGERPVGLALWAHTTEQGEAKLGRGMVEPGNRLSLEEWTSGDRIWLVDLVAPFASEANRHREVMMADLIAGPLAGQAFSFHRTDADGKRTAQRIEAGASEQLMEAVRAAANQAPEQA
jgi:cytolysin-activating lysine-acyltransferase